MGKLVFIIVFCFISMSIFSQESKLPERIISIAEELAADDSDPEAVGVYIERLQELSENPVKLNSSGEEEVSRLFFLSDFQIKVLVDYVHSSGKIESVYELANIPGFDKETVEMMVPFTTLDNSMKMTSDTLHWKNTLLTNFHFKSGAYDTSSLGPPWKTLIKYKFSAGGLSGAITAEKDPGEKFLSGNPPVPDFLSANIAYNGIGIIRRIVAGDYSARFGLGTNINTAMRTGLSLTGTGYLSARDEIRPYSSTDENNFFRGLAGEFAFKNFSASVFYSKNYSDATLGQNSDSSNKYIENFYLSGIHNTQSLLDKKDAVSEQIYGLNILYNFTNFRIGLVWSGSKFSIPVIPVNATAQDLFDFKGDRNNLYSVYYNSLIRKILFYGELSANDKNKLAAIQGMSFRPSDRLTINILYRNYNAGYVSFHGKGPGNSSLSGNEQGILGNFSLEAAKNLFISGGVDIQHFSWLKYRCSSPSHGSRKEIRLRYLPSQKLTIEGQYSFRLSMIDSQETKGIPTLEDNITRSFKLSFRYSIMENLTLGTRADYKVVNPTENKGMLLLQDINYRLKSIPVTIWFRYCLFNTDAWDSRLYTYENDLLYSFSIPALSGEGSRSYLMAKWDISNFSEMRIKYGVTSLVESTTGVKESREIKIQYKVLF
jgi:hypothetical protein